MRRINSQSGFTLVELTLAISIVAIITTAVAGIVHISSRGQRRCVAEIEKTIEVSNVIKLIQGDLQRVIVQPSGNIASLTGRFEAPDKLRLRIWTCPKIQADSSARQIDYFVVPQQGESNKFMFVRRVRDARMSQLVDTMIKRISDDGADGVYYEVIARGISDCSMRFFDGQRWFDSFNSAETQKNPKLVELSLIFQDDDLPDWSIRYAFEISNYPAINISNSEVLP